MTAAILLVACLVLVAVVVAMAFALLRTRSDLAAELALLREEMAAFRERGLATGLSASASTSDGAASSTHERAAVSTDGDAEYVITKLGDAPDEPPAQALESRLFADIVLRESVVKAASLAYGVRRGLSPANRNRIWFEMRREVKRARKDRKAEEREAIREWRARQRAAHRDGQQESDAA